MSLKAYEEFAEEPLTFPIGGKRYTVPPLGFRDGIRLQRIIAGEDHSLDNAPAEDGWKLVLGTAWDEMVADDVPIEALSRAGLTAVADFQFDRAAAERVWEAQISPEALAAAVAANRKQRRATHSKRAVAGAKTRSRASTSGTRTSRMTSKAKAPGSAS